MESTLLGIRTKNLIIRNHIESDWKYLYDYLSLPEIYIFEPGEPVTMEESKTMISERCKSNDFLAVVHKERKYMIGHLYFHHADPKHFMTWELGFIFNPKFQNKGYCTEASSAILDYAFTALKAHKVVAFCNPKNIPSWKVLEKIGMEKEGCFKQKAFFRNDEDGNPLWHDCFAYGILNNCR
jgi:[ribosomal protein S5]-alanine N-acetyltransferase